MLETEKQTNKLHKALNQGYNVKALQDEAEAYCKKYNKDLRVYLLGLKLAENSGSQQEFLDEFYNCISRIDDYKNIWSSYTIQQLGNKDFGVIQYAKGFNRIEKAIQDVINLLEQYGDDIPEDMAKSATRSVAWSAWSAARSARSAAESAAWSTRSAVRSARSAVESAESARSAARSAAWSAWSAAELAAWKNMGDCYMEILKGRIK